MNKKLPFPPGQKKQGTGPDCFSCKHFLITYDAHFPYGCRAVGFKSRLMPSKEMFVHSGLDCQLFAEKDKKDLIKNRALQLLDKI
ncbi:MAG: uracil-DNA glycosylase [Desulfobacca sp.]|nr:uracil-DNA glycosylase [Desulfobacca sp.]